MTNDVLRTTFSDGNYEHLNQIVRVATSVSLAIKQANFVQNVLAESEHCPDFWNEAGTTQGEMKGGMTDPQIRHRDRRGRRNVLYRYRLLLLARNKIATQQQVPDKPQNQNPTAAPTQISTNSKQKSNAI